MLCAGEHRSFFKLASSATGHAGFGQEADLASIFRSFKKILKACEEEYRIKHLQLEELDPDLKVPNPHLLPPKPEGFWSGFEDCELVTWLKVLCVSRYLGMYLSDV